MYIRKCELHDVLLDNNRILQWAEVFPEARCWNGGYAVQADTILLNTFVLQDIKLCPRWSEGDLLLICEEEQQRDESQLVNWATSHM